jgi:hypothetical protein
MVPGRTDPKSLSSQVKPAPHSTDFVNLLECHPPQHQVEDSGTDENTMEASNGSLRTNLIKSVPTGHVNPFLDIEIISLLLSNRFPIYKRPPYPLGRGQPKQCTQEHLPLSLRELLKLSTHPHCNTIHLLQ